MTMAITLRRKKLAAISLMMVLATSLAQAQDSGLYIGAGAGADSADINTDAVFAAIKATGATSAGVKDHDEDSVRKLFIGYRFNPYWGIELTQLDLGTLGYEATVKPAAIQRGTVDLDGTTVDLLGTWPLVKSTSAFFRLGASSLDLDEQFSNPAMGAAFANASSSATGAHIGAGIETQLSNAFFARLEWEGFKLSNNRVVDSTASALTASVLYRFGAPKSAPVAQAAPPAPQPAVQPSPQPAPQSAPQPAPQRTPPPAPAAVPTTLLSVTLDASALFDLNSAELKDAGKQQLDKLVQDLASVRYQGIEVTGHTDRLGPPDLNQRISTERADAVRNYLIGAGINATTITARGLGNQQPITTLVQCPRERSPALIRCLQPDRRVEVKVSGTRAP